MESPLLTPKFKGSNQVYDVDGSENVIISPEQKFCSAGGGLRRKSWRKAYISMCACSLGCVFVIGVCTCLIVHNLVTLNGMQEKLEEHLKAKLTNDILEQLEASVMEGVQQRVANIMKKQEKMILKRFEKRLVRFKEGQPERKREEGFVEQDRQSSGVKADVTGVAGEKLVRWIEEKVQGRLEELQRQLDDRLWALVDEKVREALSGHSGLDLNQILKGAQLDMQDNSAFKRSKRKARSKPIGKKRNASELAFVHLRGRSSGRIFHTVHNETFVWDRTFTPHGNGFSYDPDPNTGVIFGVTTKTRGVYLVYSQIGVHGNNNSGSHPFDCAHETVRRLSNTETDNILLKSVLTQHNAGGQLLPSSDGQPIYAMDTTLQMGIFALSRNDTLRVRYSADCGAFNYLMRPESSYFGVLKLA